MLSPVKIWRNQKHVARLVGKSGTVLSWTIIRVPPAGHEQEAPYPVVLVELEGGTRITCQLVDWNPSHLVAGQAVMTVIRRVTQASADGVIPYGTKAKPV